MSHLLNPSSPRASLWAAIDAIAPLHLAGSWDNVGPLVDPLPLSPPKFGEVMDERIFLTIDLTQPVYEEAIQLGATVIIAYHPPIFGGLKSITQKDSLTRIISHAIQRGIAIYSPHSALDAVKGGICDWLSIPFSAESAGISIDNLGDEWSKGLIQSTPLEPSEQSPHEGAGRLIKLTQPQTLDCLLNALQSHLSLDYFRVAAPPEIRSGITLIEDVAICPGAGGSLFERLRGPQLYFTGEMRHHDVLNRVRQGHAVILTEHTRCERGYLEILAHRLRKLFSFDVFISRLDDDPLSLWPPRLNKGSQS